MAAMREVGTQSFKRNFQKVTAETNAGIIIGKDCRTHVSQEQQQQRRGAFIFTR